MHLTSRSPRSTSLGALWPRSALLALALATGVAGAAEPPPQPDSTATEGLSKGELKAQREFRMLDFNRDGRLSRQEVSLVPRLAAVFDEADTDKDGYVSYDEVRAFAAKVRAQRERERAAADHGGTTAHRPVSAD